jgi:hypothetical protein
MNKKDYKEKISWENSSVPDFEAHCQSLWEMLTSQKIENKEHDKN